MQLPLMNVMVTRGAGFMGSHLVEALLAKDGVADAYAVYPEVPINEQKALVLNMSLPRHKQDLYGFLPEGTIRLAYRLWKNRSHF